MSISISFKNLIFYDVFSSDLESSFILMKNWVSTTFNQFMFINLIRIFPKDSAIPIKYFRKATRHCVAF